ncbi:NAD-dependent epimerase/dehydratase family protein [Tenacibaculum sp. MEBiC06402]|uniref:NAD-dependent epimerase/dehydratase family protein n=1 Tax=unclassified Tenacibaculum TaxID=2635139 RepID=UPI003B9D375A
MDKVLITGSTGFLGKDIVKFIREKTDCTFTSVGRSKENDIIIDLSKARPKISQVYDVVIHAAGKAHLIPKTDIEKEEFFNVNYLGTKNLLKGLENNMPDTFIFISTVSVYGVDFGEMIDESFPLNGTSPYALSKIKAEREVSNFCRNNNVNCVILRLPLVAGENPPGNLGAMIKAIKKGYYFRIGKGQARKSIVSAQDIAQFIPHLYGKNGIYNLTDTLHPTFKEIEDYIASKFNRKIIKLPQVLFFVLAKIGDVLPFFIINTDKLHKITKSLTFSNEKAIKELGWSPSSALQSIK